MMEVSEVERTVSTNLCSTCGASSIYCCPKCSTYSCSSECVKSHKEATACDGIRDKTAFVAADQFNDKHLENDYHFLEEITRTINNASRGKKDQGFLRYLPKNLYRLKIAARARQTELEILPIMFSRRKCNTSYLRYTDQKIFWRIQWDFPQIEMHFCDERIDENDMLGKSLDKYLLPTTEDQNQKLSYYQSMGHSGVVVLFRNEALPSTQEKYYVLNQKKSLQKNFARKRVIEFPTLLIVPKIHLDYYPLVEPDVKDSIKQEGET